MNTCMNVRKDTKNMESLSTSIIMKGRENQCGIQRHTLKKILFHFIIKQEKLEKNYRLGGGGGEEASIKGIIGPVWQKDVILQEEVLEDLGIGEERLGYKW